MKRLEFKTDGSFTAKQKVFYFWRKFTSMTFAEFKSMFKCEKKDGQIVKIYFKGNFDDIKFVNEKEKQFVKKYFIGKEQ